MQDLNLRAGRSQEVTLVHVPPPYTCISLQDKLFPHLRALSTTPLSVPPTSTICVVLLCYLHPFKTLVGP